jgi:GTP-binding protein
MFCNEPKAFTEPYRRYLLGALREHLPFAEVPIKLYLRKRQSGDTRAEIDSDTESPEAVVTQVVEPVDDSESVREG